MPSCEKCWSDAGHEAWRSHGDKVDIYRRLVKERDGEPCTPEEQAGPDADVCPQCERDTLHQHCGVCMNGCPDRSTESGPTSGPETP